MKINKLTAAVFGISLLGTLIGSGLTSVVAQTPLNLRIMAPAAPGGGWDQTSRAAQSVFQDNKITGPVQVFNVPGAGGTIGLAQLVNAKGDGNLLMTMGLVMVGAIQTNKSKVTLDQVTPIARLTGEYEVLVVPASSPHNSYSEFANAWKADPGKTAIAGGSAGGTDHIVAGLLAQASGIDTAKVNYVPFSGGGEVLAALLGNQVAGGISGYGEFEAQVKAGKLRVIGITSKKRVANIDAPTFVEQKVNVELANWRGLVAAPGISEAQRQSLIDAVAKMHDSDQWKAILKQKNWIDLYLPGSKFDVFVKLESERIAKTLRSIGIVK